MVVVVVAAVARRTHFEMLVSFCQSDCVSGSATIPHSISIQSLANRKLPNANKQRIKRNHVENQLKSLERNFIDERFYCVTFLGLMKEHHSVFVVCVCVCVCDFFFKLKLTL